MAGRNDLGNIFNRPLQEDSYALIEILIDL